MGVPGGSPHSSALRNFGLLLMKPKLWFSNRNSVRTCLEFLPQRWTQRLSCLYPFLSPSFSLRKGILLAFATSIAPLCVFFLSAYKITEHFENILFLFPGQHFSVYNKKALKACAWCRETWELPRSPGGGQWPDPAPAPHRSLISLCRSPFEILQSFWEQCQDAHLAGQRTCLNRQGSWQCQLVGALLLCTSSECYKIET